MLSTLVMIQVVSNWSTVTLNLRLKTSDVHKIFPTSVAPAWVSQFSSNAVFTDWYCDVMR